MRRRKGGLSLGVFFTVTAIVFSPCWVISDPIIYSPAPNAPSFDYYGSGLMADYTDVNYDYGLEKTSTPPANTVPLIPKSKTKLAKSQSIPFGRLPYTLPPVPKKVRHRTPYGNKAQRYKALRQILKNQSRSRFQNNYNPFSYNNSELLAQSQSMVSLKPGQQPFIVTDAPHVHKGVETTMPPPYSENKGQQVFSTDGFRRRHSSWSSKLWESTPGSRADAPHQSGVAMTSKTYHGRYRTRPASNYETTWLITSGSLETTQPNLSTFGKFKSSAYPPEHLETTGVELPRFSTTSNPAEDTFKNSMIISNSQPARVTLTSMETSRELEMLTSEPNWNRNETVESFSSPSSSSESVTQEEPGISGVELTKSHNVALTSRPNSHTPAGMTVFSTDSSMLTFGTSTPKSESTNFETTSNKIRSTLSTMESRRQPSSTVPVNRYTSSLYRSGSVKRLTTAQESSNTGQQSTRLPSRIKGFELTSSSTRRRMFKSTNSPTSPVDKITSWLFGKFDSDNHTTGHTSSTRKTLPAKSSTSQRILKLTTPKVSTMLRNQFNTEHSSKRYGATKELTTPENVKSTNYETTSGIQRSSPRNSTKFGKLTTQPEAPAPTVVTFQRYKATRPQKTESTFQKLTTNSSISTTIKSPPVKLTTKSPSSVSNGLTGYSSIYEDYKSFGPTSPKINTNVESFEAETTEVEPPVRASTRLSTWHGSKSQPSTSRSPELTKPPARVSPDRLTQRGSTSESPDNEPGMTMPPDRVSPDLPTWQRYKLESPGIKPSGMTTPPNRGTSGLSTRYHTKSESLGSKLSGMTTPHVKASPDLSTWQGSKLESPTFTRKSSQLSTPGESSRVVERLTSPKIRAPIELTTVRMEPEYSESTLNFKTPSNNLTSNHSVASDILELNSIERSTAPSPDLTEIPENLFAVKLEITSIAPQVDNESAPNSVRVFTSKLTTGHDPSRIIWSTKSRDKGNTTAAEMKSTPGSKKPSSTSSLYTDLLSTIWSSPVGKINIKTSTTPPEMTKGDHHLEPVETASTPEDSTAVVNETTFSVNYTFGQVNVETTKAMEETEEEEEPIADSTITVNALSTSTDNKPATVQKAVIVALRAEGKIGVSQVFVNSMLIRGSKVPSDHEGQLYNSLAAVFKKEIIKIISRSVLNSSQIYVDVEGFGHGHLVYCLYKMEFRAKSNLSRDELQDVINRSVDKLNSARGFMMTFGPQGVLYSRVYWVEFGSEANQKSTSKTEGASVVVISFSLLGALLVLTAVTFCWFYYYKKRNHERVKLAYRDDFMAHGWGVDEIAGGGGPSSVRLSSRSSSSEDRSSNEATQSAKSTTEMATFKSIGR